MRNVVIGHGDRKGDRLSVTSPEAHADAALNHFTCVLKHNAGRFEREAYKFQVTFAHFAERSKARIETALMAVRSASSACVQS